MFPEFAGNSPEIPPQKQTKQVDLVDLPKTINFVDRAVTRPLLRGYPSTY